MNKKIVAIIVGIIIAVGAVVAGFLLLNRNADDAAERPNNENANVSVDNTGENKVNENSEKKILVAYYSAQNHTKTVAEKIAQDLGADTFEIVPRDIYTAEDLNWTADGSRVNREHEDESLRDVELVNTTAPNWSEYDTILIGYPIWWGIAAWPVNNFIEGNDFSGKTVIPFCTSTSSGLGQSGELLERMANDGNWQTGHRFSSNATDAEIKDWLNT